MQTLSLPDQPNHSSNNSNVQMKRKPSRRANTAERRATHNAVERQRRETLNGRFLDLAALLPNLSQIRRPSKSSIVNSSIAHIHASRRHRLLAARELRSVKLESDALRRELNEWRDRAGLPRVEEPVRSEGFTMVLSGELEVLAAVNDEDDENGGPGYDGYEDGEDDFAGVVSGNPPIEEIEESRNLMDQPTNIPSLKNNNAFAPLTNSGPDGAGIHLAHVTPRVNHGPMIASSPSTVSYENPAMASMYEPQHGSHFPGAQFITQQLSPMGQGDVEKAAAWNAHLYSTLSPAQQQQLLQPQRSVYTPPASVHGLPSPPSSGNSPPMAFTDPTSQAFFAALQRQQQFATMHQMPHAGHMYGSPEGDDASSVESGGNPRERSGSLTGSGYGSPQHGPPAGSFEIPSARAGEYVPRQMSAGPGAWGRDAEAMGGMGMMKTGAISVGGGGNGCFAMTM
jgi:hypothetical protein